MTFASPNAPIAFIGGGNMARSLIGGLLMRGLEPAAIHVAEPNAALRDALAVDFGIAVFADSQAAVDGAAIWLLGVKPQVTREVCLGLADTAQRQSPLVLSVAAGITTAQLQRWLGGTLGVVRCMPNTPALLGAGVTGMYANAQVDGDGRARAQRLMQAVGRTVWIDDESRMDAVTAVSGSGPAYVFLLAEAMIDAARVQGLDDDAAQALVTQTLLGAARMLDENGVDAAELRRLVTSPGGTTQAALEVFEAGGLRGLVADAIAAARMRGQALAAAND